MTFVLWIWRLGASAFKDDGNILANTQRQAWIEIAVLDGDCESGYLWPAVKSHHINVGSEDGFKGFSDKQE